MSIDIKPIVKDALREAFYTRKVINESMSLYIKGASYDKIETLGDLSWKLMRPVWDFIGQLPEDQKAYFQKNKAAEVLTPDGDGYFKSTGILNFYTAGLVRGRVMDIMKIILTGLKQLGIPYGEPKWENSQMFQDVRVIRIPIPKNPHAGTYAGPPDLNMSNVNAYQVFHNVLQYEGEHDFTFKAKELMERIETLAHDQSWIDKNIIKPTDSDWPAAERDDDEEPDNPHMDVVKQLGQQLGGPRMIGGGLSGGMIRQRLRQIWRIAKWADDNGFEDLYVA